jgi:hypothetical protein
LDINNFLEGEVSMAITTIDGALAGMQPPREFYKAVTGTMVAGRPHSLFYLAGVPGAAVAPTPGIGGAVLTSYSGQIPFSNPGAGNTYLARFLGQCTIAGTLMLCDRLWHNSGIDVTNTGEQTFTASAQIPARDRDGTNTGNGVYAGIEVSTVTGAGTPTLTLKYTDTDGNTATATNQVATVASSIAGTFYPIGLAAGDTGIQKAQSLTLNTTWTSGTIHTVLYRVLAKIELTAQTPNAVDALTSGFVRMYDNTVPFLIFIPNTTTTSNIFGQVVWTQG